MAKRKKRFETRQPEKFERLDEELTKALDNLAERNRETELSLGEFASEETNCCSENNSQEAAKQEADPEAAQ